MSCVDTYRASGMSETTAAGGTASSNRRPRHGLDATGDPFVVSGGVRSWTLREWDEVLTAAAPQPLPAAHR